MDKTPAGDERTRLLQSCKALIFKWSSVHFKGYLDKMEEQLFRMAEKAGNNQEQNRHFQAHRMVREHRRDIERGLIEHLGVAFRNYLEQHETAAETGTAESGLALVDNDVLERSIALGTMTRRTEKLHQEVPEGYVEVSAADADRLGLYKSDRVRLVSRRGAIEAHAWITRRVPQGVVFAPFHFAEAAANALTIGAFDPKSGIPEYKVCAVRLERVPAPAAQEV